MTQDQPSRLLLGLNEVAITSLRQAHFFPARDSAEALARVFGVWFQRIDYEINPNLNLRWGVAWIFRDRLS